MNSAATISTYTYFILNTNFLLNEYKKGVNTSNKLNKHSLTVVTVSNYLVAISQSQIKFINECNLIYDTNGTREFYSES